MNQICEYYQKEAGIRISERIRKKAFDNSKILINFPELGQVEEVLADLNLGHRYLIVDHYKIIYQVIEKRIYITDFFDTRQIPSKLSAKH